MSEQLNSIVRVSEIFGVAVIAKHIIVIMVMVDCNEDLLI